MELLALVLALLVLTGFVYLSLANLGHLWGNVWRRWMIALFFKQSATLWYSLSDNVGKNAAGWLQVSQRIAFTLPGWYFLYHRGELVGGWELAGDQFREKMKKKKPQKTPAYNAHCKTCAMKNSSQWCARSKIGFALINTNIVWQRNMSTGAETVKFKMDTGSVASMLTQIK